MDIFVSLRELRFKIRKYLPVWLFDFLFSLWLNGIKKIFNVYYSFKLRSFKEIRKVALSHNGIDFQLYINPRNGFIDEYIFLHGVYENHILDLIQKHLPKGGTFLDIGANIGQHSLFAAGVVGNSGAVHSFEPIKELYDQLTMSVQANGFTNVKVHNFALGDTVEQKKIYSRLDNIGGSSVIKTFEPDEEAVIEVKRLDDISFDAEKIDLIKIDVEGFEYEVLTGAANTIIRMKPILIVEFSPLIYQTYNPALTSSMFKFLQAYYELYDIDDGECKIENKEQYLQDFYKRKRGQTNFLCIPKQD